MKRLVPVALAATLIAALITVGGSSAGRPGNHYEVTPLASDVPGMAPVTDANLQNTWGLARGPATPWWIANNGTASTSVYTGSGTRVEHRRARRPGSSRRSDRRGVLRDRGPVPGRDGG